MGSKGPYLSVLPGTVWRAAVNAQQANNHPIVKEFIMAHSTYLGWECFDRSPWEATHPLYDGAPDSSTKSFYVTAPTLAELKVAIELWERENGLDVTDEIGVEEIYDDTGRDFSDEENWIFKGNW